MCPVFIGRASERDALFRLIDRTRSGQGSVALVCGEAGIGKSRLIAEAKAEASAPGFLLLQGSCFQVDSSYPYAPLLDLLRASAVPTPDAPDPIVLEFAQPTHAAGRAEVHRGTSYPPESNCPGAEESQEPRLRLLLRQSGVICQYLPRHTRGQRSPVRSWFDQ